MSKAKEYTCYKVVAVNDFYVSRYPSKYASVNIEIGLKHCLFYSIGEVTKPIVGRIYVFRQYDDAVNFAKAILLNSRYAKIFKCVCGHMVKERYRLSGYISDHEIELFWPDRKKPIPGKFLSKVPDGTFTTEWVKPVEIMSY